MANSDRRDSPLRMSGTRNGLQPRACRDVHGQQMFVGAVDQFDGIWVRFAVVGRVGHDGAGGRVHEGTVATLSDGSWSTTEKSRVVGTEGRL